MATWKWIVGGTALALVLSYLAIWAVGCSPVWFPECNDPQHPCPPSPEPAPMAKRDSGMSGDGGR